MEEENKINYSVLIVRGTRTLGNI